MEQVTAQKKILHFLSRNSEGGKSDQFGNQSHFTTVAVGKNLCFFIDSSIYRNAIERQPLCLRCSSSQHQENEVKAVEPTQPLKSRVFDEGINGLHSSQNCIRSEAYSQTFHTGSQVIYLRMEYTTRKAIRLLPCQFDKILQHSFLQIHKDLQIRFIE